MAKASTGATPRKRQSKKAKAEAARAAERAEARLWGLSAAGAILSVLALRLAINALALIPVHFDEAQYWAYGQELAWGYFSKPPLVGAAIRATTEGLGPSLFSLRLSAPLAHAAVAGLIYLTGARIGGARLGFWAAAGYTAAPGVTASSLVVSTDPIMMLAWAGALYALIRAMEGERAWWAAMGAAIGIGFLAKYTMIAFAAGALGYALFSARGRDWRGTGIAAGVALLVALPNLLWNLRHDFATVAHVAEDADPGGGYFNPGKMAEFLGAQLGVIGPVFFLALLAALIGARAWREDWRWRLILWQAAALLLPIAALSFVTRAQPNWAAPAYIAGSLIAARWLLDRDWGRALRLGQLGLGAAAAFTLYAMAWVYAERAEDLPRYADPFKKMRIAVPFCDRALAAMAEEGAEVLLSTDRRRLSECMFEGGLGWDAVAIWNPALMPKNHHELVATLKPGDARPMLLAVIRGAEDIAARFEEAREIESGTFRTHADRVIPFALWSVRGFRGYPLPEGGV